MPELSGIRGVGIFDLSFQQNYLMLKSYYRLIHDARTENKSVKLNIPDPSHPDVVQEFELNPNDIDLNLLERELRYFEMKLGFVDDWPDSPDEGSCTQQK